MMTHFDNIVSETDYARKVAKAKELDLISGSLANKLHQINGLRIIFSHPKSHDAQIKEFLDRKTYLEALKKLKAAYDEMNELFRDMENAEKIKSSVRSGN